MKGITKPAIENFHKLVSAEKYSVPRFQRDYSWKEPNWDDLWEDVKKIIHGEYEERYMGNLVLLQKGDTNEIIDGQQRLITISLMFLAFIRRIKSFRDTDNDADRKSDLLRSTYIGKEGIVRGDFSNRLVLNRNNNDLYSSFITEKPLSRTKYSPSEKLLSKCLTWFETKVGELQLLTSEKFAMAVDQIAKSLFFSTLHVDNDLTAYIVFETLNARGVKLSSTDLLKNYLFQKLSPLGSHSLESVEAKWDRIAYTINSDDLVDFIRYYWNSRNKITRKVDLYREITKAYDTPQKVIELVDDLLANSEIYAALNDPDNELWNNSTISEYLTTLKMFGIKQPFVPLLIGKQVLNDKHFEKLLRYCVTFSFRYNIICNFSANDQELFYNKLAMSIKDHKKFSELDFANIYPNDDIFRRYFEDAEFPYKTHDMKIVRYILASIERQLIQHKKSVPLFDSTSTIEHIWSRSPKTNIKVDEHNKSVNKLGNLTLLSKSEQKQVDNLDFAQKLPIFKKSEYKVTNSISGTLQNDWDKTTIERRQRELAKQATAIWHIPNLK